MKGGAAKNVTYPCHCCNIKSAELTKFKSGESRCDRCKSKGREKCYHWNVTDSVYVSVSLFNILYSANKIYCYSSEN